MTFQLQLHGGKYPDVEKTRDYFRQLLEGIEARPGVIAAGAVLMRPLEEPVGWFVRYATDGQSTDEMMRNAMPLALKRESEKLTVKVVPCSIRKKCPRRLSRRGGKK